MSRRRFLRRALALFALAVLAAAALLAWAWWSVVQPFRGYGGDSRQVIIAPGEGARQILGQLASAGVVRNARLARLYLQYGMGNPALRAGEYRFAGPLSTPDVLGKLVRGEVVLHAVTLPEGLEMDEIADRLVAAGFGDRARFLQAMREPSAIHDLDPAATDLEGYLFPETYAFPRGTPEKEIVAALVRMFRQRWTSDVLPVAGANPPPDARRLVTLASIVEKEAKVDEERPLIAGVYANRLRAGMGLYADPTVAYALRRHDRYDGTLHKADLEIDDPYNTYRVAGLPPGPICSPGAKSLRAAAQPAAVPYLYFVARNDGTHAFASTLAEHNRNVEVFQKRYWREHRSPTRAATPRGAH